jgi:hypothetical protein
MLILVHRSPTTLLKEYGRHPNLGVLSSPRRIYKTVEGYPWAADNDAYLAWDESRYRAMLEQITNMQDCLFVTAPDVVGDSAETLRLFSRWRDEVAGTGHPIALVAQDGLNVNAVPWHAVDAIFVGGTTVWKLGSAARRIVSEARFRGIWTHMGRVNSRRRLIYAQSIGCQSVDGTSFSRFALSTLRWALATAAFPQQIMLDGVDG